MTRQSGLFNFNEPIPLVEPGGRTHGMDGPQPEVFNAAIAAMPDKVVEQPLRNAPLLSPIDGMNEHLSDDAMR